MRAVLRWLGDLAHRFGRTLDLPLLGALLALMVIGLLVLPAAAARFWSRRLPVLLGLAAALGALCVWLGLLLSFYANLPSGPCIVLLAGIAYLLSVCLGPVHGLLRRSPPPMPC